jgi:hypothetical protein
MIKNSRRRKAERKERAKQRQEARAELTDQQQLDKLPEGGAKKERAKLLKRIANSKSEK